MQLLENKPRKILRLELQRDSQDISLCELGVSPKNLKGQIAHANMLLRVHTPYGPESGKGQEGKLLHQNIRHQMLQCLFWGPQSQKMMEPRAHLYGSLEICSLLNSHPPNTRRGIGRFAYYFQFLFMVSGQNLAIV